MRYSVATVVHPFFFCVTPIPLTSTLFPYTTLFRSHRDRARQLFNNLRHTEVKSPALAPALLEFAQLELEDRHFDEAIAILDDARVLRPEAQLLDQINQIGRASCRERG